MKILAIEHELPSAETADFTPKLLEEEALRVWELHQEDTIREIYFRRDRPEAVLVLECADLNAAQRALGTLPLVTHGLIKFELIPLGPYPGFERLF